MANVYRLSNKFKHYSWGSKTLIPQFLNMENKNGSLFAEMWMGTHKGAPSQVFTGGAPDGGGLNDLINISGELPFLFKLLAIEKPLSIQAHPNKEQAQAGFKREESMLSINAPTRNYKDDNHKPEIFCAMTPVTLMAGFKEPEKIRELFKELLYELPQLNEIVAPLIHALKSGSLSKFFRMLLNISRVEQEFLCSFINEIDENKIRGGSSRVISNEQWKLIKRFASIFHGDPAILSPLYLNFLSLESGQAVFIPAGILHAYLSGFGIELMTSSDNVLRGGLTPKHVDISELMNILEFIPFVPDIISPDDSDDWFCYNTPCRDFLLARMRGAGSSQIFPVSGPAICIVTEGMLKINDLTFVKGESFFIPAGAGKISFNGEYSLYTASLNYCGDVITGGNDAVFKT